MPNTTKTPKLSLVKIVPEIIIFIIGYILIGLVNAGGAFNFLQSMGMNYYVGLMFLLYLTLVWGAPYYAGVKKNFDKAFTKFYIEKNVVDSIRKELEIDFAENITLIEGLNKKESELSTQERNIIRNAYLKSINFPSSIYSTLTNFVKGESPRIAKQDLDGVINDIEAYLTFNTCEKCKTILELLKQAEIKQFSKITNSLKKELAHEKYNSIRTKINKLESNAEVKFTREEFEVLEKNLSKENLKLLVRPKKEKLGEFKNQIINRKNDKIFGSSILAKMYFGLGHFLYYIIKFIGLGNPLINSFGTAVGGYAVATVAFKLNPVLYPIPCIILTIGGGIAGFLGAAFITREGVNNFANKVKQVILERSTSIIKHNDRYQAKTSYNVGTICAIFAILSTTGSAFFVQTNPAIINQVILLTILLNILCFMLYVSYNRHEIAISKQQKVTLKQAIDKSFKKAAPFLAFVTSSAIAAFNMFAGFKVADNIFNVLFNHPLGSNLLNTILGYTSLFFTVVAAGSFFGLFSQDRPLKGHEDMKLNLSILKKLNIITRKESDQKANELKAKIDFRNSIYLGVIYILALVPTAFTVFMIHQSVVHDFGASIGIHAAKLIGALIACAATYLCYRLFLNSVSTLFELSGVKKYAEIDSKQFDDINTYQPEYFNTMENSIKVKP